MKLSLYDYELMAGKIIIDGFTYYPVDRCFEYVNLSDDVIRDVHFYNLFDNDGNIYASLRKTNHKRYDDDYEVVIDFQGYTFYARIIKNKSIKDAYMEYLKNMINLGFNVFESREQFYETFNKKRIKRSERV